MIADDVTAALRKSIEPGRLNPFVTYADFAREHGLSETYPLAWAKGQTLNAAADALKNDTTIGLMSPS